MNCHKTHEKKLKELYGTAEIILYKIYDNQADGYPCRYIKDFCAENKVDYNDILKLVKEYTISEIKEIQSTKYTCPFFFLDSRGLEFVRGGCWKGEKKRKMLGLCIAVATLVAALIAAVCSIINVIKDGVC
jgi:hypothetical protein